MSTAARQKSGMKLAGADKVDLDRVQFSSLNPLDGTIHGK